jgi:hypothetical protein
MLSLLRFFFLLCLLRARPQDLPASQALLMVVAAANIVVGAIVVAPALNNAFAAILASLVDTGVLLGFIWLLLRFRNHPKRFLQAATAALGVGAVIATLSLPLQALLPTDPNTITPAAQAASLLILVLVVWLQVALGHVFRHALDVTLLLGVGLAFLYSVVSENVIRGLFLLNGGP